MNKEITPEVIEKAIDWLDHALYCCHALSCALDGCCYSKTSFETDSTASNFLLPLLERDNISSDGYWTYAVSDEHYTKLYPITRRDWLRKIAQELREGKI